MPQSSESPVSKHKHHQYLTGGGDMGNLIRAYDWSATSLGPIKNWPQSLRTAVGIIINSKFPMFLFWGPESICFYNDAYRPGLGNEGKHSAIGKRGADVWPEIWSDIKPLIDNVLSGGEASFSENQLLPIFRDGKLEDVYWSFSYSPVYDEADHPAGVLVTCNETTQAVKAIRQLELSDHRFQNLVREATLGIIVLIGEDFRVELANEMYGNLINSSPEELLGKNLFEVVPEGESFFRPLLMNVMETGEPLYLYDTKYSVTVKGKKMEGFLNVVYQPFREKDGTITGVTALCHDVSEAVKERRNKEELERRFRSLIEESPVATCLFKGREMIIDIANDTMIKYWGKQNSIIGQPLKIAVPELVGQPFLDILDYVYTSGKPHEAKNAPAVLIVDGKANTFYFDYSYKPIYDSVGNVYGVMDVAVDVTEKFLAQQKLEESEKNLRNTISQAPVAMCILRGNKHIVEIANERMLELWGKTGRDMIDQPIFIGLPEAKDQGFELLLDHVYNSGETVKAYEVPVMLPRSSGLETIYIDFVYEAFRESNTYISGVMVVAIDVTEQVLARKRIEEAEASARLAIESADLGVYQVDLKTEESITSERFNAIWGADKPIPRKELAEMIHPDDSEIRLNAHAHALVTGNLHYEARIIWKDQSQHWVRVMGRVLYDEAGSPQTLLGVIQDITEQKEFAEQLSKQVRERTAELNRSNEDLLQFAHVASHDLKEPVRKTMVFTNMLEDQYGALLPPEGKIYLSKIQTASERMYSMIEGVLAYSTLNSGELPTEQVNLNDIINSIESDLEVMIKEKDSTISRQQLPIVPGSSVLLYQLFYNLINNALKFSKANTRSEISIQYSKIEENHEQFAEIVISDNGIGLDKQYAMRIFDAFSRLNAKDKYEGTGLGLALCKKIVERHHGSISATGEKGIGAIFTIRLPRSQESSSI